MRRSTGETLQIEGPGGGGGEGKIWEERGTANETAVQIEVSEYVKIP